MAFVGSFDTNTILRLILGDVPKQQKAVLDLMVHHKSQQFAVADTALIETAFVLSREYKFSRTDVANALQDFMNLSQINCNRVMFDKALRLYVNHAALSLEDCALAIYAELVDATPLYTFDRKLASDVKSAQLVI